MGARVIRGQPNELPRIGFLCFANPLLASYQREPTRMLIRVGRKLTAANKSDLLVARWATTNIRASAAFGDLKEERQQAPDITAKLA